MTRQLRVLLDGLVFPEGPRWHDHRLWFSDQHAHQVVAVDLAGRAEAVAELDDSPSGLGFMPDGALLIAAMRTRKVWRRDPDGGLAVHADLTALPCEFLNDMVVDGDGRAYVGCRIARIPGRPAPQEFLALIQPDGSVTVTASGIKAPNGAVITPDNSTMIVAETLEHRISAYEIGADGQLSAPRIFAEVGESFPDGICLDADGAIWVGTALSGELLRIADGGEVLERVAVEARWPTACTLGGDDRRTLLVCTANTTRDGLAAAKAVDATSTADRIAKARVHSRGAIEFFTVDVPGAGRP